MLEVVIGLEIVDDPMVSRSADMVLAVVDNPVFVITVLKNANVPSVIANNAIPVVVMSPEQLFIFIAADACDPLPAIAVLFVIFR